MPRVIHPAPQSSGVDEPGHPLRSSSFLRFFVVNSVPSVTSVNLDSLMPIQLDDQLRRYQDLARRASDLRSYL